MGRKRARDGFSSERKRARDTLGRERDRDAAEKRDRSRLRQRREITKGCLGDERASEMEMRELCVGEERIASASIKIR